LYLVFTNSTCMGSYCALCNSSGGER